MKQEGKDKHAVPTKHRKDTRLNIIERRIVAQKESGEWIIELGDGQVAVLRENVDMADFYLGLK